MYMFRHLALCFSLASAMCFSTAAKARSPQSLRVYKEQYPRVFFFRQSEGMAANGRSTYEQWEESFGRLMGIEGKVLEEEIPGRSIRNIDFFTRFKKREPDQLVLLHFNGNARDPRYESDRFFAGHWIYYNGAKILSDVPAEEGESEIRVSNPALFSVDMGRYRNANEDIGLCMLDEDGRPNWNISEQVQLISIDNKKKTIRVRRGCYGTSPRAFEAERAYAAAHATEGPWGGKSHLLWFYNYSTKCPRDKNGRLCSDILVGHLAELFGTGGALQFFDGLEFDVLHNECGGRRRADCDADGRADGAYFDGINTYGIGVVEFCRKLRRRLGEYVIILADGHSVNNQRAFGILNGIESEGWPTLIDHQINDFSGGLNRHFFWDQNARALAFNYINHKFTQPTDRPGIIKRPDVPFNIHRLVFAAGVFTNSAMCYSFSPAGGEDGLLGIWDEFRMGQADRLGWLGKPLGPAVRIAAKQPDMLAGAGKDIGPALVKKLSGPDVNFSAEGGVLKVTAKDSKLSQIKFRLQDVPCKGPDLFVYMTANAAPREHYPKEMARLVWVGIAPEQGGLMQAEPAQTGMQLRGKNVTKAVRFMTWCNEKDFSSGFYFSQILSERIDLEFTIEGPESLRISRLSIHAHPDAIYRQFERGLVLANPSPRPYIFEPAKLFPGDKFRRIRATARQDTVTNNGKKVSDKITLGPRDALFLIKED